MYSSCAVIIVHPHSESFINERRIFENTISAHQRTCWLWDCTRKRTSLLKQIWIGLASIIGSSWATNMSVCLAAYCIYSRSETTETNGASSNDRDIVCFWKIDAFMCKLCESFFASIWMVNDKLPLVVLIWIVHRNETRYWRLPRGSVRSASFGLPIITQMCNGRVC